MKIDGHPLGHESHGAKGPGLVADFKQHRLEVILGGTALLVTVMLYVRSRSGSSASGSPAPVSSGSGGAGNLSTTGSTSVSTDMLAQAMQVLSGKETTDMQTIQAQLAALGQTVGGLGHNGGTGSAGSSNGGGTVGAGSGGNGNGLPIGSNPGVIPSGSNNPGSGLGGPVQTNGGAYSNALAARNGIGDSAIVAYFSQFKLPSWVGLQYVAQNFALPSSAAQLTTWLNNQGYRDPSTGTFTSIVSSGTVPTSVQAQLNAAYGG